jgi:SnoaL-like domain
MSLDREKAVAFVEGYGRMWQNWDFPGFVELFSDDVVYVEHPTDETVVGREGMLDYIRREQAAEGVASVRMGKPIIDGNRVAGEFWTTMTNGDERGTLIGCFIAQLNAAGRCIHFRQYWFDISGHAEAYSGWGG